MSTTFNVLGLQLWFVFFFIIVHDFSDYDKGVYIFHVGICKIRVLVDQGLSLNVFLMGEKSIIYVIHAWEQ